MKDNTKISKWLINLFCVYMIQSVLFFAIIKIISVPFNARSLSYKIDPLVFIICSVLFLVWYYRVSYNFDKVVNENIATKELFYWFLPFANAYLVFKHLRRIFKTYVEKIKIEELSFKPKSVLYSLRLWVLFFVFFYLFTFKVLSDLPFFPEDEMMFYFKNPDIELFHIFGGVLLDIVGMGTMIYIILAIQELETKALKGISGLDVIDHLVEDE